MKYYDLHVHSTFSDGTDSPESIIKKAVELGMPRIGISDHSYTYFDERYCMPKDKLLQYMHDIYALSEKYSSKTEVLCGIEQDYYSDCSVEGFDYVVGSIHYMKFGEKFIPIDESPEILACMVLKYFDNDYYAMCDEYYDMVSNIPTRTGADIIGHFDLITKFNENGQLFDTANPKYIKAFKSAVDKLLKTNVIFEINTGAMSRRYRTTPYPEADVLAYIRENGGKLILSSDAHSARHLCYAFDEIAELYKL